MKKSAIGRSTETKRRPLFKNPVLNKLTETNSAVVIGSAFLLSVISLSYGTLFTESSPWAQPALMLTGLVVFTLIEYLAHRFAYHSEEYKNPEHWQYKIHGAHHEFPTDRDILAMPLPLMLLLSAVLFSIFRLIMGDFAYPFFAGIILGYGLYLSIHVLIHTRKPPKNFFRYLWRHHNLHHFRYEDKAYGVSTPLWDIIFRTMPPSGQKEGAKHEKISPHQI